MSDVGIHTVYRDATGNWANETVGGEHVCSVHATKHEAVQHGQHLARAAQTEHVVHDIDGTIISHNSYASYANTPRDQPCPDQQPHRPARAPHA